MLIRETLPPGRLPAREVSRSHEGGRAVRAWLVRERRAWPAQGDPAALDTGLPTGPTSRSRIAGWKTPTKTAAGHPRPLPGNDMPLRRREAPQHSPNYTYGGLKSPRINR